MHFKTGLWLTLPIFTVHNIEEYVAMPRFFANHGAKVPALAARFAKPITGDLFVAVIAVITLLAVAMVWAGVKGGANTRGMFWAMVWVMGGILANGLHHLLLTLYFCAYTPGVMTSALVFIPCSIYLVRKATSERQLETKRVIWGLVLGIGLMGPVILGSKWLVESLMSLA